VNKWLSTAAALYFASVGTGAFATAYEFPADSSPVIGTDIRVSVTGQDSLLDIVRRYDLGYPEALRANPVEGPEILLPTRHILPPGPHEGIVVNLPEHRLYYYPKPTPGHRPIVITYPVSIGRMDWHSPLGQTWVSGKERHPSWYPPESIRKEHAARGDLLPAVVPPGPQNPLGAYKIRLAVGDGTYEMHGTNSAVPIGMSVTHGCMRLYADDIAALFASVPVGTKVWLINAPVKVAYVDGKLLMEVHPPVDDAGQSVGLEQKLRGAVGTDTTAIHWELARQALAAATGIPTVVGLRASPGLNSLEPQGVADLTQSPVRDAQ
jgi:L,D-transpeptidase ErfK/SrfK